MGAAGLDCGLGLDAGTGQEADTPDPRLGLRDTPDNRSPGSCLDGRRVGVYTIAIGLFGFCRRIAAAGLSLAPEKIKVDFPNVSGYRGWVPDLFHSERPVHGFY